MAAFKTLVHRTVRFAACSILLSLASCGRWDASDADRLPVFPVSGEVSLHGRPAENALVVFHPSTIDLPGSLRPSGRTGPDGKFSLSTYESGDGAPAGEYQVTITLPAAPAGPNPDLDTAPDRLKGRYANPATSKLHARVEDQENALPPFDLK